VAATPKFHLYGVNYEFWSVKMKPTFFHKTFEDLEFRYDETESITDLTNI